MASFGVWAFVSRQPWAAGPTVAQIEDLLEDFVLVLFGVAGSYRLPLFEVASVIVVNRSF